MTIYHKQLAEHFSPLKSVFCEGKEHFFDLYKTYSSWEADGSPHIWKMVESSRGYCVWKNLGHSGIALTFGEKLLDVGDHLISGIDEHEHVAILDIAYYGTSGYLFFNSKPNVTISDN